MDAQRTPEAMSTQAENNLICEKLLGWVLDCRESEPGWIDEWFWRLPDRTRESETPSFTTWAEAGLILEALDNEGCAWIFSNGPEGDYECRIVPHAIRDQVSYAETGPLAIRAAALKFIKVVKS